MDFIERLTGLAPDGGSGTTEVLFAAAIMAVAAALVWTFRRARA